MGNNATAGRLWILSELDLIEDCTHGADDELQHNGTRPYRESERGAKLDKRR